MFSAKAGNDTVTAKAGNDVVLGQRGNDALSGDEGNDLLFGGPGDDDLDGGDGDDLTSTPATARTRSTPATGTTSSARAQTTRRQTSSIAVPGRIARDQARRCRGELRARQVPRRTPPEAPWHSVQKGTRGDDTMNGKRGRDIMLGLAGNDTLNGLGGPDFLFGMAGNDTVNGDGGSDRLWGGPGDDTLNGGDGNDWIHAGLGRGHGQRRCRTRPGLGRRQRPAHRHGRLRTRHRPAVIRAGDVATELRARQDGLVAQKRGVPLRNTTRPAISGGPRRVNGRFVRGRLARRVNSLWSDRHGIGTARRQTRADFPGTVEGGWRVVHPLPGWGARV